MTFHRATAVQYALLGIVQVRTGVTPSLKVMQAEDAKKAATLESVAASSEQHILVARGGIEAQTQGFSNRRVYFCVEVTCGLGFTCSTMPS